MAIGMTLFVCGAVTFGYYLGDQHDRSTARMRSMPNSPRLFVVDEIRSRPINAWTAPFKATGALVSFNPQLDRRTKALQRPRILVPGD